MVGPSASLKVRSRLGWRRYSTPPPNMSGMKKFPGLKVTYIGISKDPLTVHLSATGNPICAPMGNMMPATVCAGGNSRMKPGSKVKATL